MAHISRIKAREILDSRGFPTLEADLWLSDGSFGRAAVPSGASTGTHEAVELRDRDALRHRGKGVLQAIANVDGVIADALIGRTCDQRGVDETMIALDGTANKSRFGANAALGVSLAFAHASARSMKIPLYSYFHQLTGIAMSPTLPVPMFNILNGGKHAANSTDVQEFMIVPIGAPNFREGLRYGAEVFGALKDVLHERNIHGGIGDEGGYACALPSNEEAFKVIMAAIDRAGYRAGTDIAIAIDVAASELYEDDRYHLASENTRHGADALIDEYGKWARAYPLVSIEDGLSEDDWDGHRKLTALLGSRVQIVGDDLFVTNHGRLSRGIAENTGNAILIKLNQIGTVSETIDVMDLARRNGYRTIISHRSGETEDTTIADFAVGTAAGQIKTGSCSRGERTCKYNQLLRIEEELGPTAEYATGIYSI